MIHAFSSVKTFGGIFEDYIDIHNFLDDSKSVFADNRHRALTHNSWFVNHVIERVFGVFIINADGKKVSTKAIAEQHILEDFGGKFIPTAQDYLQEIDYKSWMNGNGFPASRLKIEEKTNSKFIPFNND
ncbi:DUF6915 family protein [Hyunsoonleella sp. 2307UL5-6]|uniref:DUF6915 family protein n=1 Tax=Hyunsoonleella sp. 2307UL5-6 TaxID=3384768 RepID=UPI0039BCFA50